MTCTFVCLKASVVAVGCMQPILLLGNRTGQIGIPKLILVNQLKIIAVMSNADLCVKIYVYIYMT